MCDVTERARVACRIPQMNVTEAESGLAAIHCALDSPFQVESEDWRKLPQCGRAANFSSLRSGPHEFVAVAVDKAGNVSRVLR